MYGRAVIRILLTIEPRSYREAIGLALRELRPGTEVIIREPQSLEAGISSLRPELVVCSRVTPFVRQNSLAWIEIYPEGESQAVVRSIYGISTVSDFDFDTLLDIVDETARIVENNQPRGN